MRSTLLLSFAGLLAAQPKQYVGSKVCASCHPAQSAQQSASGHAASLRRAAEHPLADAFAPQAPLLREPNFRYQFSRGPDGLAVQVSDGARAATAPIQWAFGAGDQAVTFVSQLDEDSYLEHHFSYYASAKSLRATPGHEGLPAAAPRHALGVLYKTFNPDPKIMRCFQCHSTGRLTLGPSFDIQPGEPGVRCEVCHGPGSAHVAAIGRGQVETARKLIDNPRRLSASNLNQFCGNCHRKPAPAGAATNWNDPWNTRHQPLYLARSACFLKSRGALSCLTCHDPHQRLRRNDAAYYDSRCAVCHDRKKHPPLAVELRGCASCHMPAVRAHEHLRFANHWIGVYQEGATLRPAR